MPKPFDVLQFRTPLRNKDDVPGQGRRRKGKESSGERKGRQRKPSKKLLRELEEALAARNIDPINFRNQTPKQLEQALRLPSLIEKLKAAGYTVDFETVTTIDDIIRQIEGPDEGAAGGKRRRGGPGSGPAGSGEPSPIPRGGPRTPRTPVGEEKERPKDDK